MNKTNGYVEAYFARDHLCYMQSHLAFPSQGPVSTKYSNNQQQSKSPIVSWPGTDSRCHAGHGFRLLINQPLPSVCRSIWAFILGFKSLCVSGTFESPVTFFSPVWAHKEGNGWSRLGDEACRIKTTGAPIPGGTGGAGFLCLLRQRPSDFDMFFSSRVHDDSKLMIGPEIAGYYLPQNIHPEHSFAKDWIVFVLKAAVGILLLLHRRQNTWPRIFIHAHKTFTFFFSDT